MQTLPNYANHTLDELKAVVYQHMLKQGTYGKDYGTYDPVNRSCKYSVDGNKCGVGLFIPDSLYHDDMECEPVPMEGVRLMSPLWKALEKLGLTSPEKLKFLREMQTLHDRHVAYDEPFHQYLEALEMYSTIPDQYPAL